MLLLHFALWKYPRAMNQQQEYDYIIIGGGSAGSVLAARLSEDPAVTVALLETGGDGRDWIIRTPAAAVSMIPTKINNYSFETVPQVGLNGRRGYQPRGRALGGSSAINAMVYVCGDRSDYDHWASLGNTGWSYADVLPYFKRAENNERIYDEFHGQGGPLNVADLRTDNPFQQHFLDAAKQAGFPLNTDFNGATQEGAGIYQVTQIKGERCSVARKAHRVADRCTRGVRAAGRLSGRPRITQQSCRRTAQRRASWA